MKKFYLFAIAAVTGMVFSACSSDNDTLGISDAAENALDEANLSGEITISLSTVGDGMETRTARKVWSSEAASNVNQVKLEWYRRPVVASGTNSNPWALVPNNATETMTNDNLANKLLTWDATNNKSNTGENDFRNSETLKLKNLQANYEYRIIAYAYNSPATTAFEDISDAKTAIATPNDGKAPEEVFAGTLDIKTNDKGKVSTNPARLVMYRHVAGLLGYFTNIPAQYNGKDVTCVKIFSSAYGLTYKLPYLENYKNANTQKDGRVEILKIDVPSASETGVSVVNGVLTFQKNYGGNVKVKPNSVLGAKFMTPMNQVTGENTLTISICNGDEELKTWTAMLKTGETADGETRKIFDIRRNHFYSLGTKTKPSKPGTNPDDDPEIPTDDDPIDLSVDNNVEIVVNNAWKVLHSMELEEE